MRLAVISAMILLLTSTAFAQPIFDYVNAPDPSYDWEPTSESTLATGVHVQNLQMTSQTWQGLTWTHRIQILTPTPMNNPETAVMLITGGSPGQGDLLSLSLVASAASAPLVVLGDIPNQPLFEGRREDEIIAYTFQKYIETGDRSWPLLFPMTKAAVRCMDAVEEYSAGWERPVKSFYVTGASKRGWTTWFTAEVVPDRVVGIAPMVYDNLNLPAQMSHQLEAWGDYSDQIDDYTKLGLPDLIQTEEGAELASWVDPYTYRDRATMPKLVISGTNDKYWPLDAASLYFEELRTPRYILYVPNVGHGLEDMPRVLNTQVGFFRACTGQVPLPEIDWTFEETDGVKLTVTADPPAATVQTWTADSATRDFREATWEKATMEGTDGGWVASIERPDEGYRAVFAELVYSVDGRPAYLSTAVKIIGTTDEQAGK